jgi:HEAT repeat protein
VSEDDTVLDHLVGDDEWTRHRELERLRTEGADSRALSELRSALGSDDASRRSAARMALAAAAGPGAASGDAALTVLVEMLGSDDPDLRILAASAMGESGNPAAVDPLIEALEDDANVAAAAADALGALGAAQALEPLARLTSTPDFWVRAAAVVALGRIRDPRAIPTLTAVAREPGLERPVVEAVGSIGSPAGLETLEVVRRTSPWEALLAAGSILSAHPETDPPEWVIQAARKEEDRLRVLFVAEDEPGVARLLGVAGAPEAIETLVALAGPPRYSDAAIAGLLAVPPGARADALLARLPEVERDELLLFLPLLPPLVRPGRIAALIPFLGDEDATVRAAAAEALARDPAAGARELLMSELARESIAPEVVRAAGGLGRTACESLTPLLSDPEPDVRAAAADALARCAESDLAPSLMATLDEEPEPRVRRSLLRAIGRTAGDDAVDLLGSYVENDDPETRLAAIEGLGLTASPAAVPHLQSALTGTDAEALASIRALGQVADGPAAAALAPLLSSADLDRRRAAAQAMIRTSADVDPDAVRALARDQDLWIRLCATRILAAQGPVGRELLQELAEEDPDPEVREEARAALARTP